MIRLTQPGALVTIGIMERRTPYIGCDFNFQFQTPPLINFHHRKAIDSIIIEYRTRFAIRRYALTQSFQTRK
jgi:hypothetical protein